MRRGGDVRNRSDGGWSPAIASDVRRWRSSSVRSWKASSEQEDHARKLGLVQRRVRPVRRRRPGGESTQRIIIIIRGRTAVADLEGGRAGSAPPLGRRTDAVTHGTPDI